ncbi:predicted protein [Aspergillus nidulans FGSC A4]|uniref:Uncharacterized protein n=1 Tax=Emericella nidulans (strain FGSC A4 / ATCC 38163 / CBS 112.46 / NRRL 194 / M139) TaxID=227321 RepID=Q5BC92_EMENI|nr:hypothetical protein [Aspergillus nidulans FGSC A4]EAA65003.1 predicted protein [Aspergillus nidulans FGSC A4]CBF85661.1 TPA: conserved hypothetical protein [Aspergillus nidulans FGSC A4]|eukprot:XP_659442.1 predicted protein [Aspergillus nidulans FGSC A4]
MKQTLKEHGSLYALHSATATPYRCLLDDASIVIRWRNLPVCGGGNERKYGAMGVRFLVSRDGHLRPVQYTAGCAVIPVTPIEEARCPQSEGASDAISRRRTWSLAGSGCTICKVVAQVR